MRQGGIILELILGNIERALWSGPLLGLILGTGLYLHIRLRFLPLRRLPRALRLLLHPPHADGKVPSLQEACDGARRDGSQPSSRRRRRLPTGKHRGVSPFAALCTSLSATIGTGNIVGVATALALGGAGALLWMVLSALTGLAVKYAEGWFAVRCRFQNEDGSRSGGPFAYILLGLGPKWRALAATFAFFGAAAGVCGAGTFVQVHSVTAAARWFLERWFPPTATVTIGSAALPLPVFMLGLLLTLSAAVVIAGGIRRISSLSSVLVPLMGGIYVLCCLWVLLRRWDALGGVLYRIVTEAFSLRAAGGGMLAAMTAGVSRGIFSNEAGLGTAPIALAAAEEDDPERQGLLSMTGTFFDTILICTLTGLTILCAGVEPRNAGVSAVMEAFSLGLPLPAAVGQGLVLLCLLLFSFTTVVGWNYYAVQCLDFLTGGNRRPRRLYQCVYVLTVFVAPWLSLQSVWHAAGICNGLMALPNLVGLLLLSPRLNADGRVPSLQETSGRAVGTARSCPAAAGGICREANENNG